jgi:hypothetical protein
MDRIDFLLARAEATLRAAAEARSRSPARTTPGPGFSRVADPVAAAADGLLAAAAAPLLHPGASRGGSRGGYAGEMRRMADRGRSVDEALEARAGKRTKGWSLERFLRPTCPEDENFPILFSSGCLPRLGCGSASVRAQTS